MKDNIVQKLTSKDDKYACAFADKIILESQEYFISFDTIFTFLVFLNRPIKLVRLRYFILTIPLGIWSIIIAIFAAFTIIAASCPRFPVHNLFLLKVKCSHILYPFRFFNAPGLSARIIPTVGHFSSSSQLPQVSTPFFSAH